MDSFKFVQKRLQNCTMGVNGTMVTCPQWTYYGVYVACKVNRAFGLGHTHIGLMIVVNTVCGLGHPHIGLMV